MLTRPRPVPNRSSHVEPRPVVEYGHGEVGVATLQMDENLARAAMLERVLKRLLHDAIHAERHILRHVRRHVLVRDRDGHTRARELVLKAGERRRQPDQAQLRRVQTVRQIVHALGEGVRAAKRGAGKPLAEVGRLLQVRGHQRDLLAEIVVQFARDARALVLLRLDQAAAEI